MKILESVKIGLVQTLMSRVIVRLVVPGLLAGQLCAIGWVHPLIASPADSNASVIASDAAMSLRHTGIAGTQDEGTPGSKKPKQDSATDVAPESNVSGDQENASVSDREEARDADTPDNDEGLDDKSPESDETAKAQQAAAEMQEALSAARRDAINAPQQPFWNHWLWLVAFTLSMIVLTYFPASLWNASRHQETDGDGGLIEPGKPRLVLDQVQRFAFRFTALYFCLFFFPAPSVLQWVTDWVAINLFGMSTDWVPYSGSGDSTRAYIRLFSVFGLAIILSTLWSLLDRRKTDYRICRDLFHSFICYVLALTMMSYGIAKLGNGGNQFPLVSGALLESTWGDTSPMGALWKFMGASRAYTMFGGLGELVGALLLIFRRTRTLGALVTFGVMVNVVMLNFCYDVPVKINSTHLALLAFCIAMRDWDRLSGILFFHRDTQAVDLKPPYTGPRTIWVQRVVKLIAVTLFFGFPIYGHVVSEIQFANRPAEPEFFGSYGVTQFLVGDRELPEGDPLRWKGVTFRLRSRNMGGETVTTNWLTIRREDESFNAHSFEIDNEDKLLLGEPIGMSFSVPKELAFGKNKAGDWTLTGETDDGESMQITLKLYDASKSLLMGRGFRWINEVPFSR